MKHLDINKQNHKQHTIFPWISSSSFKTHTLWHIVTYFQKQIASLEKEFVSLAYSFCTDVCTFTLKWINSFHSSPTRCHHHSSSVTLNLPSEGWAPRGSQPAYCSTGGIAVTLHDSSAGRASKGFHYFWVRLPVRCCTTWHTCLLLTDALLKKKKHSLPHHSHWGHLIKVTLNHNLFTFTSTTPSHLLSNEFQQTSYQIGSNSGEQSF